MTKSDTNLLISFAEYRFQAIQLAEACRIDYADVKLHRFPDGESQLILPTNLPSTLIICRSLNDPNDKLVELILAAQAAREQGVQQLILVAPYLCYMRQDKAFHPGEVISQKIIGQLLGQLFDVVITVDAHLHRIRQLNEAIPLQHAINLTATEPMAHFLQNEFKRPLLIGPDSESEQWVQAIARRQHLDFVVAEKQRLGDTEVVVSLPAADYAQRDIVMVDDVASTGKTLLAVAEQLQQFQPSSINVLVNHALFVNDAVEQLYHHGVNHIWSCDSIPHSSNAITLAPMLAECLAPFLTD